MVENPTVQKAVIAEATKVASPSSPSDAPDWLSNTAKSPASKDIESNEVVATGTSEAASDFPIEEEILKQMQKWHIALRLLYILSSMLMGVMAGLTLVNQKNLGLFFFAIYVIFFSLLICCFEFALSVSADFNGCLILMMLI